MTMLDDDFSALEARLRRDLGPLADALLVDAPLSAARPSGAVRPEPAVADAPSADGLGFGPAERGAAPSPGPLSSRRWLAVAAAVVALAVGAGAVWRASEGDGRIETGPVDTGPVEPEPDLEFGQWIELPPAPEGVIERGHAVSVWTGQEAMFWGGRSGSGNNVQAYVGGVAYRPSTGTWREIEAPEWGHPGGSGVFHDGWMYVAAKGRVTRFNPDTGAEEEIPLDSRLAAAVVATDGVEVIVIGPASDGLGYQVVGPRSGELQVIESGEDLEAGLQAGPGGSGELKALGWAPGEYALVMPDLSVWLLSLSDGGSLGTGSLGTGALDRREPPPTGSGSHRVELVATSDGPRAVHLHQEEGGDGEVTIIGPVDGVAWALTGAFDDLREVTVAGAGEWVVLLQPQSNPVVMAPRNGSTGSAITLVPLPSPLGRANPNAVWVDDELIVWGGNRPVEQSGDAESPGAGRIRLPAADPLRTSEPGPESGSDPEAATDAADDEAEFEALQRLVDELPDDQRIPDSPYDESGGERFDHLWAEEGLWVYSRPDPDQPGPAMEAGEILLLEDWGGPIIDSWLLGYFPGGYGGQIEISNDAVYCMFVGDGGLPDSQYCRIDRTTGEVELVIHPSAIDGGDEAFYRDLYADSGIDWRVVPPGQAEAVRPFGWLYVEEGEISNGIGPAPERPTMVDESRLARLDPDTLDVIETVDLAATGERIFPCPFRDSGVPQSEEAGIPPAVQATRQAIMEAAARCDVDALEALSGGQLTVPRADGGWGMIALAMLLTQPPDVVQGGDEEGGQATYLFPSESLGLTKGEVAAVSRFYGRDGDDHLTVILEDGTWLPAGS
jgi:hypothetical protein